MKQTAMILWLACVACAQEQPARFEVATIRPSNSTGGINNRRDPVMATWTNIPLAVVIESAYRLHPDQLTGGPSWIYSDRWDIIAKNDPPATRQQQEAMLRPLLADRFQLKVHWETRQRPEYELSVAKGGPKLHESAAEVHTSTRIGRGLIDGHGITMSQFALWLRDELGRPVVDSTGISGKYDFKVEWVPDEGQPNSGGEAPPPDATGPSIFAAVQSLGLKLKAIRGPVQVLVIDRVERPSEN